MDPIDSIKDKISDIGFKEGRFTDDSGKEVKYTSLVLRLVIDGDLEEFPLSGASAVKPKLLRTVIKASSVAPPQGDFLRE